MFASFLLSLREGIEAALVIGILLAALRKMDREELKPAVWQGILAAVAVSILAGMAFTWLGQEFTGRGEEIFEGVAMVLAAVLLTWMIIWMRRSASGLQKKLESEVQEASGRQNNRLALFGVSFLAVAREGIELVLFLAAVRMTSDGMQTLLGAVLGLTSAIALGWALFASSKRMSLRVFFNVTNILLVLFAAGLLAHGIHEFNEAGIIPPVIEHVWNINPILDESQPFGQLLVALFGYNGNPALTEILAYTSYLVFAWALWKKLAAAPALKPAGNKTSQVSN